VPQLDRLAIDQALSKTLRDAGAKPEKIAALLLDIHDSLAADEALTFYRIGDIILQGIERLESTIGLVEGGRPLFPRRALSMIFGADNAGKSWMMMAIAIQEMKRGEKVLWIDYEAYGDIQPIAERFAMSGADPHMLNEMLFICAPKDGVRQTHHDQWFNLIREQKISLVVVDSYGEMIARAALDENRDADVANLNAKSLKPLSGQGAAVVIIDHTTKSGSLEWSAGSKRKRAYAMSVSTNDEEHGFTDRENGHAMIYCMKSRLGTYRRGELVAVMEVEPGVYLKDGKNKMVVDTPIDIRLMSPAIHSGQALDEMMPVVTGDIDDMIVEILTVAEQPCRMRHIKSELHLLHIEVTYGDLETRLNQLVEASVLTFRNPGGWTTAELLIRTKND
jgi:KaiC/GvpD/RAD55 family RecA-like ATPase